MAGVKIALVLLLIHYQLWASICHYLNSRKRLAFAIKKVNLLAISLASTGLDVFDGGADLREVSVRAVSQVSSSLDRIILQILYVGGPPFNRTSSARRLPANALLG
jgi:hypothetical protein